MKYVTPTISETAFNCPHCGALTSQNWYEVAVQLMDQNYPLPAVPVAGDGQDYDFPDVEEEELRTSLKSWAEKMLTGAPFFESSEDSIFCRDHLRNVWITRCFNCSKLAIWLHQNMIYPLVGSAPPPNDDLSDEILRDYREASAILDVSPRGAAALIRLAIQKLCRELGQSGDNVNSDIAALVAAGVDPRLQRAMDSVRVIGNNAVHPGQIDLRDDRATAETLFRLLNVVAEKLISEPKHIDEIYGSLPDGAKAAIERRDKRPGD